MSGVPQFVAQWLSFLPPWMQVVFWYGVVALVLFISVILCMAFLTLIERRVIGSIQRECLDHVNGRTRADCAGCWRHSTGTRCARAGILRWPTTVPISPPVQVPSAGRVIAIAAVGGLHHRYDRIRA